MKAQREIPITNSKSRKEYSSLNFASRRVPVNEQVPKVRTPIRRPNAPTIRTHAPSMTRKSRLSLDRVFSSGLSDRSLPAKHPMKAFLTAVQTFRATPKMKLSHKSR